jgi:hypothetical protein
LPFDLLIEYMGEVRGNNEGDGGIPSGLRVAHPLLKKRKGKKRKGRWSEQVSMREIHNLL